MSNDATLARTRKVSAPKTPPAVHTPSAWEVRFNEARNSALALLEAAHDRPEVSDAEIYWQLTGVAARLLAAETVEGMTSEKELTSDFFSLLALCNAAQLGNEDLDETAISMVRQAHDGLQALVLSGPQEVPAAASATAKMQAVSHAAPLALCKPDAPAAEFTPEQMKLAMEHIASMAGTAVHTLMGDDVDAALLLLQYIGTLADQMSGESITGTAAHWICGPSFGDAGKAVQA